MTAEFSKLKFVLSRHLTESTRHIGKIKERSMNATLQEKIESRDRSIGLRAGTVCYYLYSKGVSNCHYPELVNMVQKMGVDMGNLNHSRRFPEKFVEAQAEVIKGRVVNHLGTRLVATGNLPPVNLIFDKATFRHWTRNIVGVVTLVPGAPKPLQALFLGAPKCAGGTGNDLRDSVLAVTVNKQVVKAEQIKGATTDGAIVHCRVWEKIKQELGICGGCETWDPMHAAGTVDTKMRAANAPAKFKWENEMTKDIAAANTFINWGKEYDHFFRVCTEMIENGYDLELRVPKMFSTTRFANFLHKIYKHFRGYYAGQCVS